MRPRSVGGFEPDAKDQAVLVDLWHLSRTAFAGGTADRSARITWIVDAFMREHGTEPDVGRKWIYVWCVDNLGTLTLDFTKPPKRRVRF